MEVSRQGAKYGLNQFNWGECVSETRDPCPGVVCSRMQGGCARLSYRGRLSHGNSSWLLCWSETLSGNSLNLDCCFGAFTGVQGFPTPKPACSVKQPWRKEEQRQRICSSCREAVVRTVSCRPGSAVMLGCRGCCILNVGSWPRDLCSWHQGHVANYSKL